MNAKHPFVGIKSLFNTHTDTHKTKGEKKTKLWLKFGQHEYIFLSFQNQLLRYHIEFNRKKRMIRKKKKGKNDISLYK